MRVEKFCPVCNSSNVTFDAKLEVTYDVCRDCGFRSAPGVNFPEKVFKDKKIVKIKR